MKRSITYCLTILSSLAFSFATAQDPEMADGMRSSGKIYVVVAIVLVVLAGLIVYLVLLDRKVTRLEKRKDETSH